MAKVAVFGPSGMLGRQVIKALGPQAQPIYRRMFELLDRRSVLQALEGCDSVINCAGMIPIRSTSVVDMIHVNSIFPHILVSCGLPTVLVSTDCVFSGHSQRKYTIKSVPDPKDYYGRSKALGEVMAPNACIVRTSFIGCEHGFMNWVLNAGQIARSTGIRTKIDGWKNALWTGSTVQEIAQQLAEFALDPAKAPLGIVHLATEQVINKYDLAVKLIEMRDLDLEVVPTYQPTLNRALEPTHILRPLDQALSEYKCAGIA